jgi:hypothetical protein
VAIPLLCFAPGIIRLMSEVSAQKAAAQDTQESVASKRRVPKNLIIFVLKTTPLSTLQYRYIFCVYNLFCFRYKINI